MIKNNCVKFLSGDKGWDIEDSMKCPFCDGNNVHVLTPKEYKSDDYSAWEGRGSCLKIPMYCEEGHYWKMCFGFHKGNTIPFIEKVEIDPETLEMFKGIF